MQAVLDVAAAVILRADGRFLLAQRPPGRPWAGYWEFPGGKFEPGEAGKDCLARELNEELGIDIEASAPWITRVYAYPERTVRLHFFRVWRWRGTPHAREGQALSWETPTPAVAPLLPANTPVLRALSLPSTYAISAADELGVDKFLAQLERALAAGLKLVQIRDKTLPAAVRAELARTAVTRAQGYGAKVLINDDVVLAQGVGADGVHLSSRALAALAVRPSVVWCGASCHDAAALARAEKLGCDFAVLSPVLWTPTHPEAVPLGWDRFATLVRDTSIPVYALGGMSADMLRVAQVHGAHGIALKTAAWYDWLR